MKCLLFSILCAATFISCKKDNMDAPTIELTGRIVYKGEAINVEYDRVPFEVYDKGFGKVGPFGVFSQPTTPTSPNNTNHTTSFTQDGKFALVVYNGDYKFTVRPGQGPFMWPQTGGKADTVNISVSGNMVKDIEVTPYWMIRTPQITKGGLGITASVKLEKIITDAVNGKNIESAALFVNKTQFVSGADNVATVSVAAASITDLNNVTMSVAIPVIKPTQNYVFARVGLKMSGVEDLIFTPVVKITL